jgi:O-antigen/teichoic acid export membrane protein
VIRRRAVGIGAALAIFGSAAFLVSGHPLLNWPEAGLPLGTLAAGLMVGGLGALPLAIARPGGWASRIAKAAFALSVAWLPLSLLLAGNLRLNFEGGPRAEWATSLGMMTLAGITLAAVTATLDIVFTRRDKV